MMQSSPAELALLSPYLLQRFPAAFCAKWPEVSLDIFTAYAQSMPARIAAVIEQAETPQDTNLP
jgi:hypothetical protein